MKGGSARLEWRIRAFSLGAVLGLAGVYLDVSWLLTATLIVLAGGMALRVWPARDSESEEQEPEAPPR